MRPCEILRQVSRTVPIACPIANLVDAVEGKLSFHANFEFPAVTLEFPGPDPRVGRQAQVDAAVRYEIPRRLGQRVVREIGLRTDHRKADIGADTHRDHVLENRLGGAGGTSIRAGSAALEPRADRRGRRLVGPRHRPRDRSPPSRSGPGAPAAACSTRRSRLQFCTSALKSCSCTTIPSYASTRRSPWRRYEVPRPSCGKSNAWIAIE